MKNRKMLRVLLTTFFMLACCGTALAAKSSSVSFEQAMTQTSMQLLQQCVKSSGKNNVLISPDSILTAVSMVENGASGKTQTEMKKALGGLSVSKYTNALAKLNRRVSGSSGVTYRIANSLWYRQGLVTLKSPFLTKMASIYGAETYPSAFDTAAVAQMNQWVSDKTEGKITKIVDSLSPLERVVVINAVYFKGDWADPYATTVSRTFTNASGTKKQVPMLEGTENTYVKIAGADGFVKPYQGGKLAFLGLLPPKGMSVASFVKKLSGKEWIRGYKTRQTGGIQVHTRMPEFKYEYSTSLKKALKKIGIRKAFSNGATFRNMTDSQVCIDDVLHKTYIDVNKSGTEAAAVTAVFVKASAVLVKKVKNVYLDRPFVYAIIDTKTGVPLFIGTVNNM